MTKAITVQCWIRPWNYWHILPPCPVTIHRATHYNEYRISHTHVLCTYLFTYLFTLWFAVLLLDILYRFSCGHLYFTQKNPLAVIRYYNRKHGSLLSKKFAPENKTQKWTLMLNQITFNYNYLQYIMNNLIQNDILSWNHRMVWVGSDLKNHLVQTPACGSDTFH